MENSYHSDTMERAIQYIARSYKEQPSLEAMAAHVHLSKYHFQRLFHEWAGITPKQFLQFLTVSHAKKCLEAGRSTLATAYDVGLSGNGRLHDTFVKIEACTPGEFQKRGQGLVLRHAIIPSPFADLLVVESDRGICEMTFLKTGITPREQVSARFPEARHMEGLGAYGRMAQDYFATWKVPKKQIVLDLRGTPFQISVWRALLSIPTSEYVAYGDVARSIGNPGAVRAVGTAIGKNPIAVLIPCHRVIRETGAFGNYGWGKAKKVMINGYEQVHLSTRSKEIHHVGQ